MKKIIVFLSAIMIMASCTVANKYGCPGVNTKESKPSFNKQKARYK